MKRSFGMLLLAVVLTAASRADACSCTSLLPIDRPFDQARSVFVGRVESSEYMYGAAIRFIRELAELVTNESMDASRMVAKFTVERDFKATRVGDLIEVRHHPKLYGNCGLQLQSGDRLLLFTHFHDGKLYVSSCSSRRIVTGEPAPAELVEVESLLKSREERAVEYPKR